MATTDVSHAGVYEINPYDFANPVIDEERFAGRKAEKNDAKYYLNQARLTRPIHLALTGERAAGKTSMLNMIAEQARLFGFIVVRVDLNSTDQERIEFFQTLYDGILLAVVQAGAYGGLGGSLWRDYRRLMDAGIEAPGLALAFPAHVDAALGGRRRLSPAVLKQDLLDIQREVSSKIVVILDECDVLGAARENLETLRNLFTELDRFMFVIAGTPRLFPVIDEVFSPIVRQFKRVNIEPFDDIDETRSCIEQPLQALGLDSSILFSNWSYESFQIHQLTGGRPYEIQLLCHAMFRRLQDGHESHMALTFEALDAVRIDLEHSQANSLGRLSHAFAELSTEELVALQIVRRVKNVSWATAYAMQSFVSGEPASDITLSSDRFKSVLDELVMKQIVQVDNEAYSLLGDQFDELYLRYLARARGVHIAPYPMTPSWLLRFELARAMAHDAVSVPSPWLNVEPEDFESHVVGLLKRGSSEQQHIRPDDWAILHRAVDRSLRNGQGSINFVHAEVRIGDYKAWMYMPENSPDVDVSSDNRDLNDLSARARALGGNLSWKLFSIDLDPDLDLSYVMPNRPAFARDVSRVFEQDAHTAYRAGDYRLAFDLFETAYSFDPTATLAVSCAFVSLHLKDWTQAVAWSETAHDAPTSDDFEAQHFLSLYDKSLALLMQGELDDALLALAAIEQTRSFDKVEHDELILLEARPVGSTVTLEPSESSPEDLVEQLGRLLRGALSSR